MATVEKQQHPCMSNSAKRVFGYYETKVIIVVQNIVLCKSIKYLCTKHQLQTNYHK